MTQQQAPASTEKVNSNPELNESYWREKLSGFIAPTPIAIDKGISVLNTLRNDYRSEQISFTAEETRNLQSFAQQNSLTLTSVVMGCWALLLHRCSGEEDILFGATVRNMNEDPNLLAAQVGVIKLIVPHHSSALTWFKAIQSDIQEQVSRSHVSLETLKACSGIPTEQTLFDSLLVFGNLAEGNNAVEQALVSLKCPFALTMAQGAVLSLVICYAAARFDNNAVARMLGHMKTLLLSITEKPEQPLSNVKMLTDAELDQILVQWNDKAVAFPSEMCLHQLFERSVEASPDKVAMVFAGDTLTYADLNRRANQVARYLQKLGVGPDVLVAVLLERSLDMIVSIVAIAKAGGAYVPLDPSYPKTRLEFMIADTRAGVLLTQQSLLEQIGDVEAHIVNLDSERVVIAAETDANISSDVTPEHLAYVIFTSGSTGKPKGAVLNHRGRVNNFCDFNRRYNIGLEDRLLGLASLSFDMSAYDIFGTLAAGGSNIIVEGEALLEPGRWAELMQEHKITVWHSVPALLEMLVDHISERPEMAPQSLRLVLLGGDWIPVSLPDRLKALIPGVKVVSMGGATECSMDSTIYDIEEKSSNWKSIPYGVPMANQLTYVLDRAFNPLPVGVAGELYLGGIGVGRGYYNRPELTAEKFIPNPFNGVEGDRMYRTGDLARYRPDGNLELLGRIDFQVKVRGYRVELGEITSTLAQHPAVKEAVVIARDDRPDDEPAKRNKSLVAYVVPEQKEAATTTVEEEELHEGHITQWQMVYEEMYGQTEKEKDLTFNTIGWNSSYTGMLISDDEMREWVAQSVGRILALKPRRLLEIACGNGLLLFRVAPQCEKYMGIDFSSVALNQIQAQLSRPGSEMPQVELSQRLADNFEGIATDSYDTVVINSVVQLFPGIDYFVSVLAGAIDAVQPGGRIYIGDVISFQQLETFHTSIQLHQAPASLSLAEFSQRVKKQISQEEQMFIDPAFFHALKHEFPKVSAVQIQLRRGRHENEMTKFRYDVILHIADPSTPNVAESLSWSSDELTLAGLRERLEQAQPDLLCVTDVPNARLDKEMNAFELLKKLPNGESLGRLRQALSSAAGVAGIDPEDMWGLASELPYSVKIDWSASGKRGYFDVLFQRTSSNGESESGRAVTFGSGCWDKGLKPWRTYANNPLQGMLARELVPQLREYMQKELPDYMVPSAFVLLNALPLSPNGKIDRRALPAPDHTRPVLSQTYVGPRDMLEQVVADIWAEVFEFEQIGIHDNFLEMGGHSLIATQIMARLQAMFPIALPLRYLFGSPTVAELAKKIAQAGEETGVDVAEVARTVIELGKLSDEEVKAMLAGETL